MSNSSSPATSVFDQLGASGHKKVVFCNDKNSNLKAIIAIHDTTLGPAMGGTRMWHYSSETEALEDVLRLSKRMTYKSAISGLNLGGGTGIIIGDSRKDKSEAMMRSYGRFIHNMNGEYITAEELGTNVRDMEYIRMETPHVTGVPESLGGAGDPAPYTAQGVYYGIKASLKEAYGSDMLAGKTIIVQGLGKVGAHLVSLLRKENAVVFISDINQELTDYVASKYKAKPIGLDTIFEIHADVYAPCALGSTINDKTIDKIKFTVLAGSANNQLEDDQKHGEMLLNKGIICAPDYLINAGGLISCYSELAGLGQKRTAQLTENIYDATREVLKMSKKENIPSLVAANRIAEERISAIKKIKSSY